MFRTQALQVAGRAGAARTEAEIGAGDDTFHAQALDQHRLDELPRRHLRHGRIEGQDMQALHAQRFQREIAAVRAHQPEGGRLGSEEAARMRIEQGHAEFAARLVRQIARQRDDMPVPQVHAIEIAQRDHRTAGVFGNG